MSSGFWGESLLHAAGLHIRISAAALRMRRPQEFLFGRVPDYSRIRTFRFTAYEHKHKRYRTDKLGIRAAKGIILGSVDGMYRAYMLKTKTVTTANHVSIYETEFLLNKRKRTIYTLNDAENETRCQTFQIFHGEQTQIGLQHRLGIDR